MIGGRDVRGRFNAHGWNLGHWLTAVATVTPGEVRKAGQFFWRGHSNESPYEELVLEISRKLKTSEPPIRVVKKERSESIAMLVKVLTGSRSLREAKDYLNTADGKAWRE